LPEKTEARMEKMGASSGGMTLEREEKEERGGKNGRG